MSAHSLPAVTQVLHPVDDVEAAAAFYLDTLGFTTKFVDGTRYAALDAHGVTLALVGPDENVAHGDQSTGIKVADLATAVTAIVEHGGDVVVPATAGPHETRAVLRDPWGNTVVLYQPLVVSS